MTLDEAIFTCLSSHDAITQIAGDRSYPVQAPQDAAYPLIVFQRVSTVPVNCHDSRAELETSLYQVSCFALTYTQAFDLRNAARYWLEHFPLSNGAQGVLENVRETAEQVGDTTVFRADVDVSFTCEPGFAVIGDSTLPPEE